MNPIRLMIVDDHIVVRRGLRSMLAGADDVEIVGEASDAGEAVELVTMVAARYHLARHQDARDGWTPIASRAQR